VRSFNLREGINRKDDALPGRFTKEPLKGQIVEKEKLEKMLDLHYKLRG